MQAMAAELNCEARPMGCVLLEAKGGAKQVSIDHREMATVLKGTPSLVGAIISLDGVQVLNNRRMNRSACLSRRIHVAQAVARSGAKGPLAKHDFPPSFEPKLRGDVILFRTDDDGQPQASPVRAVALTSAPSSPVPLQ